MTLFLDLFWQDQYLKQSNVKAPLDRDRYFIAFLLLLWGQFFLVIFNHYRPFYSESLLYIEQAPFWGQAFHKVFISGFAFDLVLSIATLLLGFRMFPQSRIKAISLGVMNLFGMVIYRQFLLAQMDPWGFSPDYLIERQFNLAIQPFILLIGVFVLVWLIVNLLFLRRDGLDKTQPDHPLLSLNPRRAEKHQLSAVQFMWKMMVFGLIALGVQILLFGFLFVLGGDYYYQPDGWGMMVKLASLGLGIYALVLLVKRVLNIGWRWPAVVSSLLAYLVLFVATFFIYDWIYYFFPGQLGSVELIGSLIMKVMFLLYCLVQLALLCKPAQAKQVISLQKEMAL